MPSLVFEPINLLKFMPKNYAKAINKDLSREYSPSYIHKVISGKGYNKEILLASIPLIKQKLSEEKELFNQISNLLKSYGHEHFNEN